MEREGERNDAGLTSFLARCEAEDLEPSLELSRLLRKRPLPLKNIFVDTGWQFTCPYHAGGDEREFCSYRY